MCSPGPDGATTCRIIIAQGHLTVVIIKYKGQKEKKGSKAGR